MAPAAPVTLHDLTHSLIALGRSLPGWTVDESSLSEETGELIEPEKGLAASYRADGGATEVRILVSDRRAKLQTRSHHCPGVWTELEDRVLLTLAPTPSLAGRRFSSVDELAEALVAMARSRAIDAVISRRLVTGPADVKRPRPRRQPRAAGAGRRLRAGAS